MAHEDLITGLDILHAVLLDAGQSSSASDGYFSEAKRYVRKGYWNLLTRARWPWALSPTPGVITTEAKQDVTVNSISAATPAVVTLSASIATSQANKKFYVENDQSIYRIAAHTAGTDTLTLDAKYVDTTTAGSAVIFQDEYDLPSTMLKVWDPLSVRGWRYDTIKLWEKERFEQVYGRGTLNIGFGPIEAACEVAPSAYSAGALGLTRRVRFAPWSEEALNIEFDYTLFHNLDFDGNNDDGDTPHVPREWRHVIVDLAVFEMFVLKDDSKADQAIIKANQQIELMKDQYLPQQFGPVYVRPKHSAALGLE